VFSADGEHLALVYHAEGRFGVGSLHWLDESTLAFGTREGRTFWWRHILVPAD